jgi:hypothetical protein
MGVGLPGRVAGPVVEVEGVPQLGVRVVEAAEPDVGVGEVAVGAGLDGWVGQPPGGGHRGLLGGRGRTVSPRCLVDRVDRGIGAPRFARRPDDYT